MTNITETTFQGVQTVLASRRSATMSAGLFFRVGRADETLATTGITHLVEHLALHEHGLSDMHYNGTTDNCFTHFHVHGSEADVVAYLNGVCAELSDLPLERLETEKQILRTEAETRGNGPAPDMALMRYGAQGFGLSSYWEMGLPNATPERVRNWIANWFTRENAVLWITSDYIPQGLNLTLTEGTRQPMPEVTSALPTTPAWHYGQNSLTCLEAAVPRSTAGSLFASVLGKRLFRELRQEGGLCYTANADYFPRDGETAVVWAVADADPDKREAVVGGFIDVIAGLRFGTIEQAELDSVRATVLRQFDEPDVAAFRLPGYAMNLLSGHRNLTDEELVAELAETTVQDLQDVAEIVWANALFQVPALGLNWAGVDVAPQNSTTQVKGYDFQSLENDGSTVSVAEDGVTTTRPGACATVLFEDAVAMLAWPDGARRLFAKDGFFVHIEPTIHPVNTAARSLIDTNVPSAVVVQMAARDPERIPKPEPRASGNSDTRRTTPLSPFAVLARRALAAILGVLGLLFLASTTTMKVRPETRSDDIGGIVTGIILGVALLGGAVAAYRRSRRN